MEEFIRYVRCLSRTFVVIDGLDEYREYINTMMLSMSKSVKSINNISIIYFSRPMPLMMNEVGPDETLTIMTREVDLKEYI